MVVQVGLLGAALTGVLLSLAGSIANFSLLFFAQGVFIAGLRPVARDHLRRGRGGYRGQAFGMQQSATTLGGLFGPIVAGAIGSLLGKGAVFAAIGMLLFLGALLLRLHERRSRSDEAAALVGRDRLR